MPQLIFLTGYRGTGKTTVGTIVAQTLGCAMIDLDQRVEQQAGRSIREIFKTGGEESFRTLESQALAELATQHGLVVSLGGGAILKRENRDRIRAAGKCVWLDGKAETLAARIHGDGSSQSRRPALTHLDELEEIRQLLSRRRPLYQEVADHRIDTTDRTAQEVAEEVVQFCLRQAEWNDRKG
ncbi:MAG: shikimate kinase [Pirellulales bacterium]|nr:shikimate kinase [Pirellulales bacterium]